MFSQRRTLLWKGIYSAMMTELTSLSVFGWDQLFCLEASIHLKICTWRQIIVNLKAKDYSSDRYINSENRVVSLWYSFWRVESRGKIHSCFLFSSKKALVLLLTGLHYQMCWILKIDTESRGGVCLWCYEITLSPIHVTAMLESSRAFFLEESWLYFIKPLLMQFRKCISFITLKESSIVKAIKKVIIFHINSYWFIHTFSYF